MYRHSYIQVCDLARVCRNQKMAMKIINVKTKYANSTRILQHVYTTTVMPANVCVICRSSSLRFIQPKLFLFFFFLVLYETDHICMMFDFLFFPVCCNAQKVPFFTNKQVLHLFVYLYVNTHTFVCYVCLIVYSYGNTHIYTHAETHLKC